MAKKTKPLNLDDLKLLGELSGPYRKGESVRTARRRWRRAGAIQKKLLDFIYHVGVNPWWQEGVERERQAYPSRSKFRVACSVAKKFTEAGVPVSYKTILRHTYDPGKGEPVPDMGFFPALTLADF